MSRWTLGSDATRPLRRDLFGARVAGDIAPDPAGVRGLASITVRCRDVGRELRVGPTSREADAGKAASSFARSASSFARSATEDGTEDRGSAIGAARDL